jgi:signal transduction histidine kinase
MVDLARRPIELRLALAFLSVAVLAVMLVAALAFLFGREDFSTLEQQRREALIESVAAVASSAYNTGQPGWSDVDLQSAIALGNISDTKVTIVDLEGHVVVSNIPASEDPAQEVTRPIVLHGETIGTLRISFTGRALVSSIDALRDSLTSAVVGAAGIASLVALVIALIVAGRLTRPVIVLIESARAMAGDRSARVGAIPGAPSELADLGAALDEMADSLAREEQLRRDQAADIAHELRRPIAVLQALSEAMIDGVVPRDREHTISLHEEVLQLAGLVEDLQTLAVVRAAAPQLQLQRCDLGAIAGSVADAWEASFTSAGLGFTRDLHRSPIDADPGRVHQVIANLLSNALKFTPSGGHVHMSLVDDGANARLEIRDSGVGIELLDQQHLFERLWRSAGVDRTKGNGIGLAVAGEYIRAQNGTIEVDSELGRGSCFTVVLPSAVLPSAAKGARAGTP